MRDASGAAFNRLGVKGSLSAINSLNAKSVIFLAAVPEMIVANGELPRRINLRSVAHARMAGAVRARKPATAPIPTANAGV
jgi:hypothetical protein